MTSWVRAAWSRIHAALTRSRRDREFDDELREHLTLLIEEEQARGVAFAEARRRALIKLGAPAHLAEDNRSVRGLPVLHVLSQDLRFAWRSLRKSPAFTAVAVISLGLGLGANTALFSLVDALLLRPLPVDAPDRLVYIQRTSQSSGKRMPVDRPVLDGLRGLRSTIVDAAAIQPMAQPGLAIDNAPETDRLVMQATGNLFHVLGVRAAVGRVDLSGVARAAVVSDRFWTRRFNRSPDLVGRTLTVNDGEYTVIGVAAPGFLGLSPDSSVDVWLLFSTPSFVTSSAIGRLKAGVSREQAHAAAATMFARLDHGSATPLPDGPILTEVLAAGRGDSSLREQYGTALMALTALVALVLLVTCANIGTLLVVRNRARQHELAVRASLGARRLRLVSQLLVESAVIAAMGGAVAWLFAQWGVAALLGMLPLSSIPEQLTFQGDIRVLAFMAALSFACAMLFGFLPAWRASGVEAISTLQSTPSRTHGHGTRRFGLWMVGAQIALSVVLVAGAGLFVQTLHNLARADLGFDSRNLIQVELAARTVGLRPEQVPALHDRLIERVSAVPGVSGVTMFFTPLYPPWATGTEPPSEYTAGIVGPELFEVMRIPLVGGRVFTAADAMRTEGYSIVTESFARQMFPGEDAIGKRAGFGNLEVIGVVRDAKLDNVRWDVQPTVYRMGMQLGRLMSVLLVRSSVDPETVMRPIQDAVASVHPRLLVSVRTVDDLVNRSIARERIVALTSGFVGVLGLALSGIGLFGVAAFAVVRRTSELGLRMALGATTRSVIVESLRETMIVFGWGLVVGAVGAFVAARLAGRLISGLLVGLQPADWTNVAGAVVLMLLIAVVACVVPALRASRIDPLKAIKCE